MVTRLALLLLLVAGILIGADRATLLAEIVPPDGPAWPPYQIAAHAVGLAPASADAMNADAVARQDRLAALRQAQHARPPTDADDAAIETLLAYAFGEIASADAVAALAAAAPARRLDLARLLLADADLDAALAVALPLLAGGPQDQVAGAAARLLADVARDRAAIAQACAVVPLRDDAAAALARLLEDPAWAARTAPTPGLAVGEPSDAVPVMTAAVREWEDGRSQVFAERVAAWDVPPSDGVAVGLRLDTAVPDFHLHRRDAAWPRGGSVVIDCRSRYHGAIAFALHRCADRAVWDRLDPAILATAPLRAWQQTFAPLHDCNRVGAMTGSLRVDDLEPGWYVVTARARGAPVVAAQRVAVSAVQLTVLADHAHAVVVAIDRRSGAPIADAAIEVAASVDGGSATLTQVTTSAHGIAEIDLDPGIDPLRSLRVDARLVGDEHLSSARSIVAACAAPVPTVQAALWSAVGTVAPGATAHLAGVVRVRTGATSRPPDGGDETPRLVLMHGAQIVLSADPALDAHGRFAWDWTVPREARPGTYRARLGATEIDAFTVTATDLPAFVLTVGMERPWRTYRRGETARLTISARAWNGVALGGVALSVPRLPEGIDSEHGVVTDDAGTASIDLRLSEDCALGGASAAVCGLAADGARTESTVTWNITDDPFHLRLSGAQDPTVGSIARVAVDVKDWDGNPVAGAAVRIGDGDAAFSGADGSVSIVVPTAHEGVTTVAVSATTTLGSAVRHLRYTVRPKRAQNLGGVGDAVGNGAEALAATIAGGAVAPEVLDEFRPFVRAASMVVGQRARPAWTPRDFETCHERYLIADGKPAEILLTVGTRADRSAPAQALIWASGERVHAHRLVAVTAANHVWSLPVDRSWAPATTITALILDGDHQVAVRRTVHVLAPEAVLRVAIGGVPPIVRPGQRLDIDLTVTDATQAQRADCAVVVRVVDLADVVRGPSRTNDFGWYRFLLPRRGHDSGVDAVTDLPYPSTDGVRWWTMGMPAWAWSHADRRTGHGGRHGHGARASMRSDWRRLALWRPDLVTDEQGRTRFAFTVPDRLTTWRIDAWAVADDGAIGEGETDVMSRIGAAGTLPVPAFVRAGDRIGLRPGVQDLDRAERAASLELSVQAADAELARLKQEAAGGAAARACQVVVPTADALRCALTTTVAGVEVDRLEHIVPILPAGERRVRWRAIPVAGAVAIDAARLIDAAHPRSVRVSLELERGPARILADAIDALITHPHGCVEQTLSRFLPAVLAARAAGDAPDAGFDRAAIDAVAIGGIARLGELQQADGGWGWFGGEPAHPALTALAVEGLATARDAGLPVTPRVIADGVAALDRLGYGPLPASRVVGAVDVELQMILARVAADGPGALREAQRADLRRRVAAGGPTRDRCLAARILALAGELAPARRALPALLRSSRPRAGDRESLIGAAEVLALAALAQPEGDAQADASSDASSDALSDALFAARSAEGDGASWGDTYTTATVVRALATRPTTPDALAAVTVERRGLAAVTLTAERPRVEWVPTDPAAAVHLISAGSATCRMRVEWIGAARARARAGSTTIALEAPVVRDGASLAMTRGQVVTMTWLLRVRRPLANACLTIPLPAGVSVLDGTCPGAVSTGAIADGWCAYLTRIDGGEHRVALRVVAGFAGDLGCPAPRLWPMYDDDPGTVSSAPSRWTIAEP
ncbi:MAG TPA: alpha-2-macroglobulin family protein [Planctomycetota bacterium]|nr:alpha-2-macroglobulin family protein [Planctomycetota bacterium]